MKEKILRLFEHYEDLWYDEDEICQGSQIDSKNFDKLAADIVKLLTAPAVSKSVGIEREALLLAFVKVWKEELKDENWMYLDFMVERFLSKQ